MSTLELKNHLKSKIDAIDDETFLSEINSILNQSSQPIYILSNDQKIAIKKAQIQYLEGDFEENSVVNEEIEKWLNE